MVIGAFVAIKRRTVADVLILLGFLTAPLAASILVEEGAIRRATAMLIFGALLAAIGAARIDAIERILFFRWIAFAAAAAALLAGLGYLSFTMAMQGRISETATRVTVIGAIALVMAALAPRVKHGRLLVLLNAIIIAVQFGVVVRDYHGEYESRLAPWLQGNIRGAVIGLMDASRQNPDAPIYVTALRNAEGYWDIRNRFLPSYWRFYAIKLGREDVIAKARFLTEEDSVDAIPSGSLVLGIREDAEVQRMIAGGATKIADIDEIDRPSMFTLLRK
jgi:hypothetical protein